MMSSSNCQSILGLGSGSSTIMFTGLFWLVMGFIAIILIIQSLNRRTESNNEAPFRKETPSEILLTELARGSISEEEYLTRKKYMS